MPIIMNVGDERSEVDAIAIGPINYADIENHLLTERYFNGLAYKEFLDARGAGISLTPDEVRRIVALVRELGRQSKLGPTAVLVSSDFAFGIFRTLEVLLEDVCVVRTFRDEQEARTWLAMQ
jgi:hypothetical protein